MPGARTVSRGYSAVQTARLVSALRWVCGRLSEIVDAWACEAAADSADAGAAGADAVVEMTVLSRRLAAHRGVLDGLQPDSERLSAWRQAAPADASLAGALDGIAALEDASERLAVAREVLVPQLLGAYRQIVAHAAPHCDGALASAAGSPRPHPARGGGAGGGVGGPRRSRFGPCAGSSCTWAGRHRPSGA